MKDKIKLLGEPETIQQPTFPSTRYQITPDGLLISHLLGPGITFNGGIGEADMNEICKQWLESRKAIKQQLDIQLATIRNIEKSKLH